MSELLGQGDLLAADQASDAPVVLNTAHARAMVRKRYPAPEWACMLEVAPSTGGGTRYADAVAVNLWSSRGHAIIGMEIKVSRSDWLREMKKPEKAEESVFRFCDQWLIVAPKGVVKDGELPPTWGMLELRASGLVQVVAPPRLTPEPITKAFFASLMRRSHEQIDALAESKIREARLEGQEQRRKDIEQAVASSTRHHKELLGRIEQLKAETGIDIEGGRWGISATTVETIKLAQRLEGLSSWRGRGALDHLNTLAKQLDAAADAVRKACAETELELAENTEGKGNG